MVLINWLLSPKDACKNKKKKNYFCDFLYAKICKI